MTDEQPEKREEPDEEELERRLQAILGGAGPSDTDAGGEPDEFELKLREIEDKAASIKSTSRMPDPPDWDYKRPVTESERRLKDDSGSYRGIGVGLTLAYAMVGPLIVGWGVGWLMDRGKSTNQGQTWGTVIGMFLGFIAVVFLLSRTNRDK
jgi:F0F1-type ATP synthase assembly protein I